MAAPRGARTDGIRLLRSYHDALEGSGVNHYGFEQCLADYRIALLERTGFVVRAMAGLDISSDRGRALVERGLRSMVAGPTEMEAAALLPG